jgi:hypothetical protein
MSKYRNIKTEVDGIVFDSKAEARRYMELRLLEKSNEISDLRLQYPFECKINEKKICTYRADFDYFEGDQWVVEDVKGFRTQVYKLKKKLVEALHGIEIREVKA